jgi:hypothetical protein
MAFSPESSTDDVHGCVLTRLEPAAQRAGVYREKSRAGDRKRPKSRRGFVDRVKMTDKL